MNVFSYQIIYVFKLAELLLAPGNKHPHGWESLLHNERRSYPTHFLIRLHEFTSVSEGLRANSDYNKPQRDHQRVGRSCKTH